jgi:methionyl-tRNA synthetase
MPHSIDKLFNSMNIEEKIISWNNSDQLEIKPNHKINKPEILFEKIEDKTISEQKEKLK